MTQNKFLDLMREKLNGRMIPCGKINIDDIEDEDLNVDYVSQSSEDLMQVIENKKHLLRTEIIALKRQGLSSNRDFETVDLMLAKNQNLNYSEFRELGLMAPECAQRFFTAQYFLMFPKDRLGAIASEAFSR
jgi:hypothetical protein